MGGHGATVLLSLKRTRFRIWEIENALFCGKPENPKFRSEFRNSAWNLKMPCGISHFPCGNAKFCLELGNSRRKSRIPIGILKFCVESENATRNFAIPCGNQKFRVEIENSRRKSQIPIRILKFCAEFQKAKRNLAIPCRNRKFRVEFENSIRNCEIPIGTFIGAATVNVFPQPATLNE